MKIRRDSASCIHRRERASLCARARCACCLVWIVDHHFLFARCVPIPQSADGVTWSATDGKNILFPNISTDATPTALFVGPFVWLNGNVYAAASPGILGPKDAAAQGSQFCLWPDPVTPRNCGPPSYAQEKDTLLMRRVLGGQGVFGPMFWATATAPPAWVGVSKILGIKTLNEMDSEVRGSMHVESVCVRACRSSCVGCRCVCVCV
jgi:hypothetical protein